MAVQLPDPDAPNRRECQFCGSSVTRDFRRVFGNKNNVAERCLECDTAARVYRGSAAGRDVPEKHDPAEPDCPLSRQNTPALTDGGMRG